MMERCPCCNARLSGALVCPRCQSDLANVVGIGQQASFLLEQAMRLWFAGEAELAVLTLVKARSYQDSIQIRIFSGYILQHYRSELFRLLGQGQYQDVLQAVRLLLRLQPNHLFLEQLRDFVGYLQKKKQSLYSLRRIIP